MENATKALLIAAAVLVAILIISLGLVVYNMASETINSVNFSGHEVTAFNDQFEQYQGASVRGSEVNAMLKTVLTSNLKYAAEGNDLMLVNVQGDVTLAANADHIDPTSMANTAALYTIEVMHEGQGGLVNRILVTEN